MDIIVLNYYNKAIWTALVKHINYILYSGSPVVLFIVMRSPISSSEIEKEFTGEISIIYCKSRAELILKLIRSNNKKIFVTTVIEALFSLVVKCFKRKRIYFWVQGIIPEEDYLRFNSILRFNIFLIFEKVSFKICSKFIFVSEEMKQHFSKKYNRNFDESSIVIPCISDLSYTKVEKERHSYVYIGGLHEWQRFDEMLKIFNKICEILPTAKFYVVTFSIEEAKVKIEKYLDRKWSGNIKLFSINDRNLISSFLSKMEYGFLLRDDIPVNQVSSPIKFAEYLSCGVNPIISDAVRSYADLVLKSDCGIVVSDFEFKISQIKRAPNLQKALKLNSTFFSFDMQLQKYKKFI